MNIYNEIPKLNDTAVALGCFDGLHLGHRAVIDRTDFYKVDKLYRTVFSFSDDIPYKKDTRHIITFEDKCEALSDMGVSNLIIPSFELIREYSPAKFFLEILVDMLGAKLIVCGENYHFGKHAAGNSKLLRSMCAEYGIEYRIVAPVVYQNEIISSSRVRCVISNGDMKTAEKMLGRLFSYKFEVVGGRRLGRTLGTPTINQYFPDNFVIPRYGVYASVTEVGEKKHHSVTNIGIKPTVGSDKPLSETWIPDFHGDLYGKKIRVSLVQFMREEQKFSSLEELKTAILRDGVNSKELTTLYI